MERPAENDRASLASWIDKVMHCKNGIPLPRTFRASAPGPLFRPVFASELFQYGTSSVAHETMYTTHSILGNTTISSAQFAAAVDGVNFGTVFDGDLQETCNI